MLENISLIKEVHEHMPIEKSQELAMEFLNRVNLSNISLNRIHECSTLEIFYVMFIRALMSSEKRVIIEVTSSVVESLVHMQNVLNGIELLNIGKEIVILDLKERETYYKESRCNIIKLS